MIFSINISIRKYKRLGENSQQCFIKANFNSFNRCCDDVYTHPPQPILIGLVTRQQQKKLMCTADLMIYLKKIIIKLKPIHWIHWIGSTSNICTYIHQLFDLEKW